MHDNPAAIPTRFRLFSVAFSVALCTLFLAACTAQTPTTSESTPATTGQEQGQVEVEHLHGTATVPVTPERVVVFDIVSLDTLDALGVKPTAVAGSVFPTHLAHYGTDDLPKVGTLFEPDYEALAATNPDLIIIGGRSSAKYDELTKFGPTIDLSLSDDDYWGSTQKNARQLGKIFALEDEVEAQLTEIQSEVEAVAADTADAGNALVVLTTGGKMSAYGPASRFGIHM